MKRLSITAMIFAVALLTANVGFAQDDDKNEDTPPAPIIGGNTSAAKVATSGRVKIQLKEGMVLEGSPVGIESIQMASLFGEAKIPLHTIAGIRFSQKATEQSTVVLLNGDALTGELAMTELKCIADWGQAAVNVGHIVSVVFRPDLTWSSVPTPSGDRWQLKKTSGTVINGAGNGGTRTTYPAARTFPSNR